MGLENLGLAFVLTMLAGLSTSIGGLIALFAKRTNTDFYLLRWGFGGVMIYVAMVEIFAGPGWLLLTYGALLDCGGNRRFSPV